MRKEKNSTDNKKHNSTQNKTGLEKAYFISCIIGVLLAVPTAIIAWKTVANPPAPIGPSIPAPEASVHIDLQGGKIEQSSSGHGGLSVIGNTGTISTEGAPREINSSPPSTIHVNLDGGSIKQRTAGPKSPAVIGNGGTIIIK